MITEINSPHRRPYEPFIIAFSNNKKMNINCDLNNNIKKHSNNLNNNNNNNDNNNNNNEEGGEEMRWRIKKEVFKEVKVICSVPSSHSRKPSLQPLFSSFFTPFKVVKNNKNNNKSDDNNKSNYNDENNDEKEGGIRINEEIGKLRKLELFARELTSGWTCWGNEVLAHQSLHLFNLK